MRKGIDLENVLQKSSHDIVSRAEKKLSSVSKGLEVVLGSLEDARAEDVVSIDVRSRSSLADYIVVASARSQRHISAVASFLLFTWKDGGYGRASVEGLAGGDWVLIDMGDIIVHLFRPEVRLLYNLEKMWLAPDLNDTESVFFGDH